MVVAVIAVLMVQEAVDDLVGMVAMRHGFVPAAFTVFVVVAGVRCIGS